MPTIKVEKQMDVTELLGWARENKFEGTIEALNDRGYIKFVMKGNLCAGTTWHTDARFIIETEEEIDEDTKIPKLLEISSKGLLGSSTLLTDESINEVVDNKSKAFYMLNDDMSMTLIWKNGSLVK